jgi:hypothetical protein
MRCFYEERSDEELVKKKQVLASPGMTVRGTLESIDGPKGK